MNKNKEKYISFLDSELWKLFFKLSQNFPWQSNNLRNYSKVYKFSSQNTNLLLLIWLICKEKTNALVSWSTDLRGMLIWSDTDIKGILSSRNTITNWDMCRLSRLLFTKGLVFSAAMLVGTSPLFYAHLQYTEIWNVYKWA